MNKERIRSFALRKEINYKLILVSGLIWRKLFWVKKKKLEKETK